MSYFSCRLLVASTYRAAVGNLERAANGDTRALEYIREHCRNWLRSGAFLRWHSGPLGGIIQEKWLKLVDQLPDAASPEAAESISKVFIASTCMPEFQASYMCNSQPGRIDHSDISPNIVSLADFDGGLFGVLVAANRSFEEFFFERFSRPEKYGVGEAMIIFDHGDLLQLRAVVEHASDEKFRAVLVPEACLEARSRLISLIARCLSSEDMLLAVEDTGG